MTTTTTITTLSEKQVSHVNRLLSNLAIKYHDTEGIYWEGLDVTGFATTNLNDQDIFEDIRHCLLSEGYDTMVLGRTETGDLKLRIIPTPLRNKHTELQESLRDAQKYRKWWSDSEDEISELKRQIKSLMEIGGMDECHSDPKVATISKAIELLLR